MQIQRRWPTLDHVWLWAAIALIALRPLLTPVPPNDFWWHMATGRLIAETGAIPVVDQFSYTQAGEPFYNQSWLAQLLLYGVYSLGGMPMLIVLQAVVLATAYGLLLLLCIRRSGALRLSVALLLMTTMPLSFDNWIVRPQSYAFPIFAAFLYILTAWRYNSFRDETAQGRSGWLRGHRLWLLPPLMVVWVNLHGSFVLGGVLIALVFAGELAARWWADRQAAAAWATRPVGRAEDVLQRPAPAQRPPLLVLFGWGIVTALALVLNPRGLEVIEYVRNLLTTSAVTDLVTEWAPPTTRAISGLIFFIFLAFCLVVLAYARRAPDLVDMLLLVAFLWLAFGAVRNIVWFGMVATPLLAVQAATMMPAQSRTRFQGVPAMNGLLIGCLTLLLLLGLPWVKPVLDLPPAVGALVTETTPVAAVEELRADPVRPQHLFHDMAYGSYLIWAAPEQPVFADPRIELYPYEQWQDYLRLSAGRDVDELMHEYGIDGLLLDNEHQARLLEIVEADPTWEVRYADEETTYLRRAGAAQ